MIPRRIVFSFLLFFYACTPASKVSAPSGSGKRVQVFYNNDNFAYLETCGCRVSPIGGMDRRFNAMQAYSNEGRVFVDSGNLLFKSPDAPPTLAPQWLEQAHGVIEAYNILGADAVAPGENDFALGLGRLEELMAKARFPLISSNIVRKGTGKPAFRESVLTERHGKKIGIFALFGEGRRLPAELELRDTYVSAKAMVAKLREQGADMVIALTHQGYDADVKLARTVKGIDLLVGSHTQSLIQKPDLENGALIVQLSNQGQVLGMVEYEAESLPKTRTQFVVADLDDNFNETPGGGANPMKALVSVTKIRIEEANKKAETATWEAQGQRDVKEGIATFLSCRDCHESQASFQEAKPHAAAYLTLLAKHQERNLDCVKCHSVGLNEPGGFTSTADAFRDADGKGVKLEEVRRLAGYDFPKAGVSYRASEAQTKKDVHHWIGALKKAKVKKSFVSVQCENCHGRLPGHPFSDFKPGKVSMKSCVGCHTPQQAPGWYSGGKLNETKAREAFTAMSCPR